MEIAEKPEILGLVATIILLCRILLVGSGRYFIDTGLVLRLGLLSQERNRSPDFYSSIYSINLAEGFALSGRGHVPLPHPLLQLFM